MLTIAEITAGVIIGIFSSIVGLLLFQFALAPRVEFSRFVRTAYLTKSKRNSYSIKIKKNGFTDLIDTQIRCRVAVKDIGKNGGELWNYYDIPTSFQSSLRVKKGTRIIHLNIHLAKSINLERTGFVKENIDISTPETGMRFEDIFVAYEHVYVRIFFLGTINLLV